MNLFSRRSADAADYLPRYNDAMPIDLSPDFIIEKTHYILHLFFDIIF